MSALPHHFDFADGISCVQVGKAHGYVVSDHTFIEF